MTATDPLATDRERLRQGLRMSHPPDPAALAAERRELVALESAPLAKRLRGYWRLVGPGYLQSAMTLGGGTAASALYAGALFGYELLWVAPVGMLLGIVMLSAISYQTLSTGLRPLPAMARFAGKPIAWTWAVGALLASVIWHFPQYSLASACLVDIGAVAGFEGLSPGWLGVLVLAWAVGLSLLYGSSASMLRVYERSLKVMVWGIVVCFGLVVLRTGIGDVGALLRGFVPGNIPAERNGVAGFSLVLAGLAAAVGINMVFLYPYSLLARGWGREHRRLARFDLYVGMLLPFLLASSLIVIAAANTLNVDPGYDGRRLSPVEFSGTLANVVGPTLGRVVFNLGVLGMALSTITAHMLCAGFVGLELFGFEVGSWKHRLATLIPTPAVLGPIYWSEIAVYLAVPTSILCGLFLPFAYFGFVRLQRSREYLGEDVPRGTRGRLWLAAMVFTTLLLTAFFGWEIYRSVPKYFATLFGQGA